MSFIFKKKKKTFLQLFVIILDCFRSLINACLFDKINNAVLIVLTNFKSDREVYFKLQIYDFIMFQLFAMFNLNQMAGMLGPL